MDSEGYHTYIYNVWRSSMRNPPI